MQAQNETLSLDDFVSGIEHFLAPIPLNAFYTFRESKPGFTWADFEAWMIQRFSPSSALQIALEHVTHFWMRDVRQYDAQEATFMEHYALLPNDPAEFRDVVSTYLFRCQLPAELRDRVRLAPNKASAHTSLEELMDHCRQVKDVRPTSDKKPSPDQHTQERPQSRASEHRGKRPRAQDGKDRKRPKGNQGGGRICSHCQKPWHVWRECHSRLAGHPPGNPAAKHQSKARGSGKEQPKQ